MQVDIREHVRPPSVAKRHSVLLVDDEERILNALYRLLRESYHVERTTSPVAALEHLGTDPFAVIISDQRMPDMLGTELCARAAEIAPHTVRVILTGHSDMNAAIDAINRSAVYRFMLKPWKDQELRALVRDAVELYDLGEENRRLNELTKAQNEELTVLNDRLEGFNANLRAKVFERTRQVTQLNQQLTSSFRGTVDLLARLSNMHSRVLGNHGRRVAEIAVQIGRDRGMEEDELAALEIAATLHDIGKIGMDPEIVGNPAGRLTARNEAVLRTHPVTGAGLISRIPGLDAAVPMVRHHHERFDGHGFPDRLAGGSIPLGARIIAVTDAFDNFLNMHNRYTVAEAAAALEHLQRHAESRFDPRIIEDLSVIVRDGNGRLPEADEVEINAKELRTGMALSRNLVTTKGVMLLKKGEVVTESRLHRLLKLNESDPFIEGPYIYRKFPVEAKR